VIFSSGPFLGCDGATLSDPGGDKLFGVVGLEETVKESLNNIAGAFARGVSGRTYGTSGCREYGNTGNTVITPTINPFHRAYIRLALAVLQALNMMNNSMSISLISPHPVVMIKTSFPRTDSWI
jgi:hypothetical protein